MTQSTSQYPLDNQPEKIIDSLKSEIAFLEIPTGKKGREHRHTGYHPKANIGESCPLSCELTKMDEMNILNF